MGSTSEHTKLVADTRIALGREPDLTLWHNVTVVHVGSRIVAKPGLGTGSLDLVGILAPSGRMVALDAKTGGASLSKEQRLFADLVRRRGGFAATFSSVDEARAAIDRARQGHNE